MTLPPLTDLMDFLMHFSARFYHFVCSVPDYGLFSPHNFLPGCFPVDDVPDRLKLQSVNEQIANPNSFDGENHGLVLAIDEDHHL